MDLGSRAFDLLMVLLNSRGSVVSKREIQDYVWPAVSVEESNLRVQMASLRKALGPDRDVIKTIPGRGYLFAAESLAGPIEDRVDEAVGSNGAGRRGNPTFTSPLGREKPIVAVIEDDRDMRDALQGWLLSADFRVKVFESVQAFRAEGPALPLGCIVSDVWMPGQSGLELQASLNAAGIEVPLIFISGHADVPMSVRAMKAGAVEFFTKPVRHEELLAAIDMAVARRGPAN